MSTAARPVERDLVATIALAAYSAAVAAGFARVFSGWEFLPDLLAVVVVGHGLSFVLRRLRVSAWLAVPAVAVALGWLVVFQYYRPTTRWLLPTATTWDQIGLELDLVREQFPITVAPVPYGAGWALIAAVGVAIAVLLADTFAFRAEARAEALVPGGVLYVFVAALGDDRLRVPLTVALVAAGVMAVVALRWLHDRWRRVELVDHDGPRSRLVPVAFGTAAAVALVAGVVGPRLPGADAEPLYDTRGRSGGVTEVVSPLVSIRARLVNRSNEELFRVSATEPAYWRLTTLPEFDGETFGLPRRSLEDVDGEFGAGRPGTVELRQSLQIQSLGGPLVPAAADPIAASGRDLRWNPDTSTLLVAGDELERGDEFTVVSAAPRLQPAQLRLATSSSPPDPIHLELPADFPVSVRELAAEVTDGTASTYDAAIALQDWFRSEFDYSTEVQQGHGTSAIEVFLEERIGYCEQFSATFAAMARTLGIPSRVAVGFTPGLQTPDGWYSVLDKNAHAWPEIWFDRIGWVAFEPTPNRGSPGAEDYTGVAPAQDGTPGEEGAGGGDGEAPNPTTTVATPASTPGGTPNTGDGVPGIEPDPGGVPVERLDAEGGLTWWPFVAVAVVALAMALPALVRRSRRRLRARAAPERRVVDAWTRATTAVSRVGVAGRASMTASEWARATTRMLPIAARPMQELAATVDRVVFAPPGSIDLAAEGSYGTSLVRECVSWSRQVEEIARDSMPPRRRFTTYFTDWD